MQGHLATGAQMTLNCRVNRVVRVSRSLLYCHILLQVPEWWWHHSGLEVTISDETMSWCTEQEEVLALPLPLYPWYNLTLVNHHMISSWTAVMRLRQSPYQLPYLLYATACCTLLYWFIIRCIIYPTFTDVFPIRLFLIPVLWRPHQLAETTSYTSVILL